jgi:hypothetical protein
MLTGYAINQGINSLEKYISLKIGLEVKEYQTKLAKYIAESFNFAFEWFTKITVIGTIISNEDTLIGKLKDGVISIPRLIQYLPNLKQDLTYLSKNMVSFKEGLEGLSNQPNLIYNQFNLTSQNYLREFYSKIFDIATKSSSISDFIERSINTAEFNKYLTSLTSSNYDMMYTSLLNINNLAQTTNELYQNPLWTNLESAAHNIMAYPLYSAGIGVLVFGIGYVFQHLINNYTPLRREKLVSK